jgi:hypothetical protein
MPTNRRNELVLLLAHIDQKIAEMEEVLDGPLDDLTAVALIALSELLEARSVAELTLTTA